MRQKQFYEFTFDPNNVNSAYYAQLKFLEGADSILEIGCSSGFFSRHLVTRGSRVVGVEINAEAAEIAKDVCQHVIVGDVESAAVQAQVSGAFDAVVFGDIIEHLKDPKALLITARKCWLTPQGWGVVSVPNSGHWIFRREVLLGRFPYRQYGLFDHTHLHFYTRQSLHELVLSSGYIVEKEAFSVNANTLDDLTFLWLAPFYHRPSLRHKLNILESWLAKTFPSLFAYQFILSVRPSLTQ